MDVLTRIVVPGGSPDKWLGSELVTPPYKLTADPTWIAGSVSGSDMRLDAQNEAAGAGPNTGLAWPAGRHRVTFGFTTQVSAGVLNLVVRVVSVGGGGAGSVVATDAISAGTGSRSFTRELNFDTVGGTSYQPQMYTVDPTAGANEYALLQTISHSFIPVLGQNEQAHTEPDNGIVHKRDSSGNLIGVLGNEGEVPFYLPPGLTAIFIVPLDAPLAGYTEPQSVKGRTVTVTATGAPRYTG